VDLFFLCFLESRTFLVFFFAALFDIHPLVGFFHSSSIAVTIAPPVCLVVPAPPPHFELGGIVPDLHYSARRFGLLSPTPVCCDFSNCSSTSSHPPFPFLWSECHLCFSMVGVSFLHCSRPAAWSLRLHVETSLLRSMRFIRSFAPPIDYLRSFSPLSCATLPCIERPMPCSCVTFKDITPRTASLSIPPPVASPGFLINTDCPTWPRPFDYIKEHLALFLDPQFPVISCLRLRVELTLSAFFSLRKCLLVQSAELSRFP